MCAQLVQWLFQFTVVLYIYIVVIKYFCSYSTLNGKWEDMLALFIKISTWPDLSCCFFVSQNFSSKTLKKTRKFVIDGVEVSVTTSKIIGDDEKKDEEMRFLRCVFDSRFMVTSSTKLVQCVQYAFPYKVINCLFLWIMSVQRHMASWMISLLYLLFQTSCSFCNLMRLETADIFSHGKRPFLECALRQIYHPQAALCF